MRQLRLSDRLLRDALSIAGRPDVLDAERWASGWMGKAWVAAALGEREPERQLLMEVVGRACTRPSQHGLAAVAALRRVCAPDDAAMLDETAAILSEGRTGPPWSQMPAFTAVRAWRAADVWDSERLLFVEYGPADALASAHTLMAQVVEPGGTLVATLGVLSPNAAQLWARARDTDEVPMPLSEQPVEAVLADLAAALRHTDMTWPRQDDEDFVELRALAWARCRDHLPDWPAPQEFSEERRRELVDVFLAEEALPEVTDIAVIRSLAELFCDYGEGYIASGPLAWSPDWVGLFLADWLPRKALLDAAQRAILPEALRRWLRFALRTRGCDPHWIAPVVAAVDRYLPEFTAAVDDESSWGPAKQIVAELTARGIDFSDKAAVDAVISELNAARLARRLIEE